MPTQQNVNKPSQTTQTEKNRHSRDTLLSGKVIAKALALQTGAAERLSFAQTFCFQLISSYWRNSQSAYGDTWPLPELSTALARPHLSDSASIMVKNMGEAAAALDPIEAGYLIGAIYTAMIPADMRSKLGVYYTPPALANRLLDLVTMAGVDWANCKVLDPACGGGAFLAPVARRIADRLGDCEPAFLLHNISTRLHGFEIDPFAAWTSQVFLEAVLMDTCRAAGRRLPSVVTICDSLNQEPCGEKFDLVIGNPPYGKVRLSPDRRKRYGRSLFGHANLYGLFTDLALRFARPGGMIAYVTPTSFLAGEYFKALRTLLGREGPPVSIDFVALRKGIFEDVLQEIVLATYQRDRPPKPAKVHIIELTEQGDLEVTPAGTFTMPEDSAAPWLVPRLPSQAALVNKLRKMPHRLENYGYIVSTGPLVWNRHKTQLKAHHKKGYFPLIWAEAVTADGHFKFRAAKKNHKPYFKPKNGDDWLIVREPCVLLQRTTAKEQRRRLIAAELPVDFIATHGGVVVENHLNMIRPKNGTAKLSASALAVLLNSETVDQAFRCINGSVAVSAFELRALPLPPPKDMKNIENLVMRGASQQTINQKIARIYGGGTS